MTDQKIGILEPTSPPATKQLDSNEVLNTAGTAVQQERVVVVLNDPEIHQYFDTMVRLLYDIRAQLAEFCPEAALLEVDVDVDGEGPTGSNPT